MVTTSRHQREWLRDGDQKCHLLGHAKHTGRWAALLHADASAAFTAAATSGLGSLAKSVALPCLPRVSIAALAGVTDALRAFVIIMAAANVAA